MNLSTLAQCVASGLTGLMLLSAASVAMANADTILQTQCATCHALTTADQNSSVAERLNRKAPPLHYAGNKYQHDWLVSWLVKPSALHPAGYFPQLRVRNTGDGDQLDDSQSFEHPALDAADAASVADALMTLTSKADLIAADNYQPGTVAMRMGVMDFRRFKGCDACHQDSTASGGLSGPVLYNAAQRLQPAYLSSFIQNPVAWDAHTIMPVLEMNEAAVHRLVHYLLMLEK
jgi:cytochrome c2